MGMEALRGAGVTGSPGDGVDGVAVVLAGLVILGRVYTVRSRRDTPSSSGLDDDCIVAGRTVVRVYRRFWIDSDFDFFPFVWPVLLLIDAPVVQRTVS